MRFSWLRRLGLLAIVTLGLSATASGIANAETGTVRLKLFKAGWFIGAQAGSGIFSFRDQIYPLRVGGLSAGLTFGGSATDLVGNVRNLRRAEDIEGVYTAIGAGLAVAAGSRIITMQNANGVVFDLQGEQIGLQFDLDLSGMTVSIKPSGE